MLSRMITSPMTSRDHMTSRDDIMQHGY